MRQTDESGSDSRAYAQMLVGGVEGEARKAMLEAMLGNLLRSDPGAAELVAAVLLSDDDHHVATIGRAFLDADLAMADGAPVDGESRADLLIVAIKPVEVEACLTIFGVAGSARFELTRGTGALVWRHRYSGLSIATVMVGVAGNTRSSSVVTQLVEDWRPRFAVLLGTAAGNADLNVSIGDVVVAESVLEYEFKRMTNEGILYAPQAYSPSMEVASGIEVTGQIDAINRDSLRRLAAAGRSSLAPSHSELDGLDRWSPRTHLGVVLAGATLVEDGSFPTLAADVNARAKALEMDGAGFAQAVTAAGIPWLVVRGISDHGEAGRGKQWQFPASLAAACVVRRLVDQALLPRGERRPV